MFKLTAFVTALSMIVTSPALALSCAPWNPIGAYNAAEASGFDYEIGYGQLVPVGTMPTPGPGVSYSFNARFVGSIIGGGPMQQAVQRDLSVHVTCVSIWCGHLDTSQTMVLFMRDMGAGHFQTVSGPCPQWVRQNPSQAELIQLTQCSLMGAC